MKKRNPPRGPDARAFWGAYYLIQAIVAAALILICGFALAKQGTSALAGF